MVDLIVPRLEGWEGIWAVALPLGTSETVPPFPISREEATRAADNNNLEEPPSVTKLQHLSSVSSWQGETHTYRRVVSPGILDDITFSRTLADMEDDEPFDVHYHVFIATDGHADDRNRQTPSL